jgi:hypothetical protein
MNLVSLGWKIGVTNFESWWNSVCFDNRQYHSHYWDNYTMKEDFAKCIPTIGMEVSIINM